MRTARGTLESAAGVDEAGSYKGWCRHPEIATGGPAALVVGACKGKAGLVETESSLGALGLA
jgi:hypothetical protein